jgi:hypothetical protein
MHKHTVSIAAKSSRRAILIVKAMIGIMTMSSARSASGRKWKRKAGSKMSH